MILEDYVSFETAKLLKEKGFDEYCLYVYLIFGSSPRCVLSRVLTGGEHGVINNEGIKAVADKYGWKPYSDDDEYGVLCPSFQMAMRWLREIHRLYAEVLVNENLSFHWTIHKSDGHGLYFCGGSKEIFYGTYEAACEDAIKYCLEKLI